MNPWVLIIIITGPRAAVDAFTSHTPFMDAGLDSLDLLKLARCVLRPAGGNQLRG